MTEVLIDIDKIIQKLLESRNKKMIKPVNLSEEEITAIIRLSRQEFLKEKMLVEVEAPIKVCGDIHGQYSDLLRQFQFGGYPPDSSYLFLGDYVDRGRFGIETICLLMSYKIKYPKKITILRGNHETASITRVYGFYEECKHILTQVNRDTLPSFGKNSQTVLIAFQFRLSSIKGSFVCMVAYRLISSTQSKLTR